MKVLLCSHPCRNCHWRSFQLILDLITHESIRVKRVTIDHQLAAALRVSDVTTVLVLSRTSTIEVLRTK